MAALVAQPQASRAGLIATIVISFVLNGLLAVLFFKQSNETMRLQSQITAVTAQYSEAVTDSETVSREYNNLKEQARLAGNLSVYDLLNRQQSDLAVLVVGQPMSMPEVAQRANQANRQANVALQDAAGKAGLPVGAGGSLLETLSRWPAVVNQVVDQREQLMRDATANEFKMKAAESAQQLALAAKDKAIADARSEVESVKEQLTAAQHRQEKALVDVRAGADQRERKLADQLAAEEVGAAQKDRENATLRKEVMLLKLVVGKFKYNPAATEAVVRVTDGQIKVVAGNECFINLGKVDEISAGMTFEVYDSNKSIPPLGNAGPAAVGPAPRAAGFAGTPADSYVFDLPKGKGSIEVVSVGPDHTAECRIIRQEPGQRIGPGDLIDNLVYDRNTKFNFYVYGDFDLGRNTGAHGDDVSVIRRLIEQWGGKVQPIADAGDAAKSISPDIDFVVVGKEPQMPNLSAEEQRTPPGAYEMDKFQGRLQAYRAVLARAAEYGIPVMNQNRFLYYTGFFDQAKR